MIDALPPEPPSVPSRKRTWWIAIAVALIVLAGMVVLVWRSGPAPSAAQTAASAAPVAVAEPVALPRPAASAPTSQWQAWVTQEATAILKSQTAALLSGNFEAYLAGSVPGATAELGRQFRSLRALHVTRFEQTIDGNPWAPRTASGDWRIETVADYCLVDSDCATDFAESDTLWRVTPQGLRFTGSRVHNPARACYRCMEGGQTLTRPWQTTELAAQAGKRTLVAVPIAYRDRLADLSRRVEAAAAIADRYTVGAGRVDRYRVYLADRASWKRWYVGAPADWVAGLAIPTGRDRIETAVAADSMTPDFADELLRHELAHVSTLRNNSFYGRGEVWWLVEGMAEHVALAGAPGGATQERRDLRKFLRSHKLSSVAVRAPGRTARQTDAAGRYAVGYFALQHLITKYGRNTVLTFFEQAVQQGIGLDAASRSALGRPWKQVDRECAAAVRQL
ncbi:MAG: hypothetical protein SYR96_37010 [Actinomycetota bacterium]|nr:hypothetical protein [Actinomycetota bacterium]